MTKEYQCKLNSRIDKRHKKILEEIADKLGYKIDWACKRHKPSIGKMIEAIATGELWVYVPDSEQGRVLGVNYASPDLYDINDNVGSLEIKD